VATVIVLFEVQEVDLATAERIVEDRLERLPILLVNDSNDIARGTGDPIWTYTVVPSRQLLDDSL
jgi:hypothetical protein